MARAFSAFANGGFRIDGSLDDRRTVRARSSRSATRSRPTSSATTRTSAATGATRSGSCARTRSRRMNSILQRVVTRGNGHARRAAGPPGRRQDRHDRELRRRVVRRLHAAARHGGLGRLPEQARADDERSSTAIRSPAGRIPAMIWKTFMEKALSEPAVPGGDRGEVLRVAAGDVRHDRAASSCATGKLELDNGDCRDTLCRSRFSRATCRERADCKPNEVEVPSVVGAAGRGSRCRRSSRSRSRRRTSTSRRRRGSGSASSSRSTRRRARSRRTTA